MAETAIVERHSLGFRIIHWLQVALVTIMVVTGYGIYSGTYLFDNYSPAFGYFSNFGLHMMAATFLLMVNVPLLLYFLYVEKDLLSQIIRPRDIKKLWQLALNFIGVRKEYPLRLHRYDLKNKVWVDKYHPMQKFFLWAEVILLLLAAVTGYGMYKILYYGGAQIGFLATFGFIAEYMSLVAMKKLHFAILLFFAAILPYHIYLALIPVNWDLLKSNIYGKFPAKIKEE
jgi:cytochrome b subunit of formate dehydrogenase